MALSRGAIARALQTKTIEAGTILQIIEIKSIAGDRFRLQVSDGDTQAIAMLPAIMNERVKNNEFPVFVVVSVAQGAVQEMQGGKFVFFLVSMEAVQYPGHKIGDPQPIGVPAPAVVPQPQQAPAHGYGAPAPVPSYGAPPQGAYSAAPQQPSYGAGMPQVGAGGYGQPPQQMRAPQQQQQYPAQGQGHFQPPPQQPQQQYGYAAGPVARAAPDLASAGVGQQVQPIASLNPYASRWTIKVRITAKTDLKSWSNPKGSGTLFSIDLLDEAGGEIRATFFKEAADKFFPLLATGRVYLMSGGTLKVANKKFSAIRNEYELQFNERSTITPVEDDANIKNVQYNFVKISILESYAPDSMVDVIGVVTNPGVAASITTKTTGKTMMKKDVQLADESGTVVNMTFWEEGATRVFNVGDILCIKNAKLGSFGGRSLSASFSSVVEVNPPHVSQVKSLSEWYTRSGSTTSLRSISDERSGGVRDTAIAAAEQRKCIEDLKVETAEPAVVKAMVLYVKTQEPDKLWYPACPGTTAEGKNCNKKMLESGGGWMCPNNCATNAPVYRYIMSCRVHDHTGSAFITLFDEQAKELLGRSANDLRALALLGGSGAPENTFQFEQAVRAIVHKDLYLWLTVKNDFVKDEMRMKSTVRKMRPVVYATESRALLDLISKYPTA